MCHGAEALASNIKHTRLNFPLNLLTSAAIPNQRYVTLQHKHPVILMFPHTRALINFVLPSCTILVKLCSFTLAPV